MRHPDIFTKINKSVRWAIVLALTCLFNHSTAYAAFSGTDLFTATVDGLEYHISAYWWYDTDTYETHYNGTASVIGINNGTNFTTEVKIPSTITVPDRSYVYPVTYMSASLFLNDAYLETFILENTNIGINEKVFENCRNLVNVNLGEGVEFIGPRAFMNCPALKTISIPPTNSIRDNAFDGCTALETVNMSALKYLGKNVFKGCTALKSIAIPSIGYISENAFDGCTALTDVEITGFSEIETDTPPTYQIGKQAFTGCSALRNVVLKCTEVPSCAWAAFDADTYATATLFVPEGTLQAYRDDRVWGRFQHIVEGNNSAIIGVDAPAATDGSCDVYSLSGTLLRQGVPADSWKSDLAPGIYIVRSSDGSSRKAVVR